MLGFYFSLLESGGGGNNPEMTVSFKHPIL